MVSKPEEYKQRIGVIDLIVKKNELSEWETRFLRSCKSHFIKNKELTNSMRHFYLSIMEKHNYGKVVKDGKN